MKNKINQITIVYLLIALFAVIVFHKLSIKFVPSWNYPVYNFAKDITLVTFTGLIFRLILKENNRKNKIVFEKLKANTAEIRESNEKFNIVAKATSDTIWDWNIIDDKISWNNGINSIFGYNKNQVGKTSCWWFEQIHPEDSIKMSIKLYAFIEQRTENWQDEYRFKCADNSYKYVLDRGFLIKDQEGKPTRMIGAIQDITKRKQEELRLKLLETVIIQTKDAIVITEATFSDNQLPKIVYVNPAFTIMTGYSEEEVINGSPDILQGPKTDPKVSRKIITAIKEKKEALIEMICYTKEKKEFWLLFSMIPIFNKEKELSHWVSIQRDITDEKRQEKEKEHLIRELTKNNKDLKHFSYITSHNLRAPISNLTGLLNLIEDITIEDNELKEILHGFNKSTNLLNDTINDLTKVMIIKDNTSIEKEPILLKDVFENVFNQLSFEIYKQKPILKIDFDRVPALIINKSYIESILLNLLSNALKYRSDKRPLKITVITEQVNNLFTLTFKDNGIGIDLDRNHDKVFGLYQRFHNYPDSKGLGLYLVKSQVEAMGGTISINSEVDKGTTFTLIFKNKQNVT
ncbi:PAS domain-containing sensor histidine kinase [Flavobacterium faecale]|uniref:histidine kinase n=1 Tax=Flavobacterium faecale TaxID=1355330 RepID=A0A2S1LDQ1_9FLAO|nr:PAS domain-containing sensor histidine kinase [Flavobacterium faecale]AWG21801.1 PAS domain-containing sensor histidine kinase [Flavobacterium faecale]